MVFLQTTYLGFGFQLLDTIKKLDTWLFLKINNDWTNPFLDSVFPLWREANTWIPLYFFLLLFMLLNFGIKCWPWIVFLLVGFALTDQSSNFFKVLVNRPRPCYDDVLMGQVRLLLGRCPSSQSFTSSHATNHFGLAMFLYLTLKPYIQKWGLLFFIWAATISYGQVYVGVHYPLDILGGCLLGCTLGFLNASFFNRRIGLPPLKGQSGIHS